MWQRLLGDEFDVSVDMWICIKRKIWRGFFSSRASARLRI